MGGIGDWYPVLENRKFPPMLSVLRAVEGNMSLSYPPTILSLFVVDWTLPGLRLISGAQCVKF